MEKRRKREVKQFWERHNLKVHFTLNVEITNRESSWEKYKRDESLFDSFKEERERDKKLRNNKRKKREMQTQIQKKYPDKVS